MPEDESTATTVANAVAPEVADAIAAGLPIGVTMFVAFLAWRIVKRFARG